MTRTTRKHDSGRQRGAVLVVGLVFLALLSLMGATAYAIATQEERMAGNTRDKIRALEAAEAVLRDCEAQLVGVLPVFSATGGAGGFYSPDAAPAATGTPPKFTTTNWSAAQSRELQGADLSLDLFARPRCIVEQLDDQPMPGGSLRAGLGTTATYTPFRVTARGVGANPNTVVILQSTLVR